MHVFSRIFLFKLKTGEKLSFIRFWKREGTAIEISHCVAKLTLFCKDHLESSLQRALFHEVQFLGGVGGKMVHAFTLEVKKDTILLLCQYFNTVAKDQFQRPII